MSQGGRNVFNFRGPVIKEPHLIWLCYSFLIRQNLGETIGPLTHGFLRPCIKHVQSIKIDGILQLENCKGLHDCMYYGKTAVRQNKCNFQFLIFDLRTYILKRFVRRLIDDVSLSYPSFRKKVLVIYILVQKDFWHSVFRKFPTICHWGFAKVLSMSKDHF